ncbi:class F sortase [Microbacterium gorillae]|uniref:class F sortase n=1 Tax=Microbacterium gorillae TaxID=1231063 RepID=UPI000693AA0F|nr:class F sortase [Microbacterium gorillae]
MSAATASTRRWKAPALVAAAVLAGAVVVIVGMLLSPRTDDLVHGVDLTGRTVTLDAGSDLTPAIAREMNPTADTGERFVVPSVGLDVALGELTLVHNTITPPGFTSAYAVRNLGVSPAHAAEGTVYIAMHSLRDGAIGPGNALINVDEQRSSVGAGAEIDVAGVVYTVTEARTIRKSDLAHDTRVWANTPDRLVVITCLQRPEGGPSTQNLVITAERPASGH